MPDSRRYTQFGKCLEHSAARLQLSETTQPTSRRPVDSGWVRLMKIPSEMQVLDIQHRAVHPDVVVTRLFHSWFTCMRSI
jgi:hypothetical protein